MEVRIVNIRHGKGDRRHIIYAEMLEAKSGVSYISATLHYILDAIEQRGHVIVGEKNG